MAELRVLNLFARNVDGKDAEVKRFKQGIVNAAKQASGKVDKFEIEDGIITVTINDDKAADVIKKKLDALKGASVIAVADGLDGFIQQHNSRVAAE